MKLRNDLMQSIDLLPFYNTKEDLNVLGLRQQFKIHDTAHRYKYYSK